jgi:hypothetical protein
VARLGDRNNLSPATLAIFGTLDDTRKIKDLDFGAIVLDLAGNRGELYDTG